ncbi:mechanosensitive ion channel, partial [Candidatus Peregrinibacteria bacterium]|nr:mechanosensitive ion channel [Candidatus Peregrinibacteria bacterium]
MEKIKEILAYQLGPNTVYDYVLALVLFVAILVVFKIFKNVAISKLKKLTKKTENEIDDEIIKIIEGISPLFYVVVALYFPLKSLVIWDGAGKIIDGIFVVVVVYQVIRSLQTLIEFGLRKFAESKGEDVNRKAAFQGIKLVIKIVLWSIGILVVLSNLGINITTLVASLGIGGVAVALAVQNILSDIFSSFSIYFDKPFVVGDYIVVGEHDGVVKKIGLKTTRIQTLEGEELVVSNQELTTSRIQNYRIMKERRIPLEFGVIYETPLEKLRKINGIVENIIKAAGNVRFDRCHFIKFADSSLNFEAIYYVLSGDINEYLQKQEKINFAIMEEFQNEGIEMAYPTQTIHMAK